MTNAAPGPAVAIIGTGAMGSGIAQVAAQAGCPVHLVDAFPGAAAAARERLAATLDRLAGKGRITRDDADAATARLTVTGTVSDLPPCALVIEAIREDLADKRALFTALAEGQPADTLLASNTSSLDVGAIADGIAHPGRILGLHFFNPPPLMRLVEVVHGDQTDDAVLERATEMVRAWGKTPVRCTSTPGFIVNRVARPFYGEAQRMVEAGVADPATIDYALRELAGFRMGPMELTDLIGQDVNLAVGTSVWEQTGRDERYAPTDYQRRLVQDGRLGRKTGRGVFTYDDSGHARAVVPDEDLARRLVGRAGRDQPGGPDPGHARQRGGRPGGARRGQRRGRRHRDAPGHQLPPRSDRVGCRDRAGRRRRAAGRARRGVPRRPLPPQPGADPGRRLPGRR